MSGSRFRCSIASEDIGEPMLGTASVIRRWLLVEHDGPWGANALRDARMLDDIRAILQRAEHHLGIRVLLIRRPDRQRVDRLTTIAAVDTGATDPWIERIDLPDVSALAARDLTPLGIGGSLGWTRTDDPIFVVCTHGRRDPCCAERGRPLAASLARGFPDETWESSHVGGDRFAGNLVIFPEGLYFGRIDPDHAAAVVTAYLGGRLDLASYRGRACFPMDVQAAEHLLRMESGWERIGEVSFEGVERTGRSTQAGFRTPDGPLTVTLERRASAPRNLTCHAGEPSPAPEYHLIAIDRPDGAANERRR